MPLIFLFQYISYINIPPSPLSITLYAFPCVPYLSLFCSLVMVAWVSLRTTASLVPSSVVTAWPLCPFLETCHPAAPTCCSQLPVSSTSLTLPVRKQLGTETQISWACLLLCFFYDSHGSLTKFAGNNSLLWLTWAGLNIYLQYIHIFIILKKMQL